MFWCCCRWLPLRLLIWQRKLLGGSVLGDIGTFYIALEGVDANSVSDFVAEEVSIWSREPTADEATILVLIKQPMHQEILDTAPAN